MTRMRHPREDVAGEINIPDEAVSMHRMSGWLTDDEWARAGLPEPEPEAEPDGDDEESEDETPEASGGQKRSRRARSRATSEGNED